MPIRIYALAKQLNLDSKILAGICDKAGVTGKGSALASLSDDEVTKVKAFIEGSKAKRSAAAVATGTRLEAPPETGAPIRREDYMAPTGGLSGRMRVLADPRKKEPPVTEEKAAEEPIVAELVAEEPVAEEPVAEEPVAEEPVAEEPVAEEPVADEPVAGEPVAGATEEAKKATKPPQPVGPIEPTEPLAPIRPLTLTQPLRPKSLKAAPPSKPLRPSKPSERTAPAIKLAPMPTVQAPKRKKSNEPTPQKPDIRLPADAILASKAGKEPLSAHLRKHEKKKKKKDAAKKDPTQKPGVKGAVPLGEMTTREQPRRGVRGAKPGPSPTLGGREARQLKRKRVGTTRNRRGGDRYSQPRRRTRIRRTGANTAAPRKGNISVQLPCTVKSFSEAIGVPVSKILGKLLGMGTMSSINADLDAEMAELMADEFDIEVDFQAEVSLESKLLQTLQEEDDESTLEPRPPIITFLGHVDHGKTSLLDRIIGIDVVSGEKGGITQHIRAYRVEKDGRAIAFVDTPGHEAFTEMRARGANVTDIAVLVVAADDGVMPQTEEAISHGRAAGVPIVVALNKMDLPGVTEERAFNELARNDLLPAEWGGDTEVIKTSATTGEGVDDLLEMLLTVAELHEFTANPNRPALGTCLEAELHEGRGVVAKLLVQRGTLNVGDVVVCGPAYGRVKAMYDTLKVHEKHEKAGPSTPVNITGLNVAPGAGDRFYVLDDITQARQLADQRGSEARERELAGARQHVTLENLFDVLGQEDAVQTLNIILRADVRGSIEAIKKELTKLEHPEVQIKILQATVGGITEADVHLADASDAVIIGFNVVPDEGARLLADQRGVQVRRYDIIYQITDDLRAALEGMLKPAEQEKGLGRALVQRTFQISRLGTIAGCRVIGGTIERDARARVIRESRIIGDYKIDSLKREKDDAREVREGLECGIKLVGYNDLKEGDILEMYRIEEIRRTFEETSAV